MRWGIVRTVAVRNVGIIRSVGIYRKDRGYEIFVQEYHKKFVKFVMSRDIVRSAAKNSRNSITGKEVRKPHPMRD